MSRTTANSGANSTPLATNHTQQHTPQLLRGSQTSGYATATGAPGVLLLSIPRSVCDLRRVPLGVAVRLEQK